MNKKDDPSLNGHVVYPYNPITKDIFLKEVFQNQYDIFLNDTKIATQNISLELKNALIKKGFRFEKIKKVSLQGRKKVSGIKIDVSKIMDGKDVKELLIRITANTHEELIEKIKLLTTVVRSITKIDYQITTWNKLERC